MPMQPGVGERLTDQVPGWRVCVLVYWIRARGNAPDLRQVRRWCDRSGAIGPDAATRLRLDLVKCSSSQMAGIRVSWTVGSRCHYGDFFE